MDFHSNKIIGYAYYKSMPTKLDFKTIENTCRNVKDFKKIMLYNDIITPLTEDNLLADLCFILTTESEIIMIMLT